MGFYGNLSSFLGAHTASHAVFLSLEAAWQLNLREIAAQVAGGDSDGWIVLATGYSLYTLYNLYTPKIYRNIKK